MAALCLVLYTIVISRMNRQVDVILGGAEGTFISSDSVTFIDPSAMNTPEPTEDIWPQIDITLSQYTMVSESNLLAGAYAPDVEQIKGTYMMFSVTAISYLEDLLQAARDEGFTNVYVAGAYRSYSYQTELFNGMASKLAVEMGVSTDYMDESYQEAVAKAKTITFYPGASEHQLGLAVDLMDKPYNSPFVYSNMDQDFFTWLDAHCAEYGFIKRYPTKKLLLTGWDEPWHYRYVGVEAATFIMENDLCYEEFYQHYVPDYEY